MKTLILICIVIGGFNSQALAPDLKQARDSVRQIIQRTRCASCHTPGPEAREKALEVYNLSSNIWSSTLNNDQLNTLGWILSSGSDEEIREIGSHPEDVQLDAKERAAIKSFVEKELKFRQRHPDHRFGEIQRKENPVLANIFAAESDNDCPL